ncbi:5-(carboxyamino)imidazole ribonucleotide synthase [Marinicella sp. S1101]|uniref:5-(carboxyamino)imidazole ribonucleotide synthase n=1 Tax=Marinicella marina TaxID=2996016 RepID=UPI00226101DF|nr:5-(carboxyamino)imidazole ribonucleotide synthase [Marinicella marina]MCX7554126.1 5-(carboxyamino)imidazole ribonucleotide synthase [Marinicella marina]MDJ1141181.1 5-(carboxyamino)imidazole ribonucleotide synthase [Marinicella marina]
MNPRIGILGAGQLARMLALSGYPLGFEFVFYDPTADACAGQVGEMMTAEYHNEVALEEFCKKVDIVTLDFENVPVETLKFVQKKKPVFPTPEVLEIAQDRLLEKQFCHQYGIPTTDFETINSLSELKFAAKKFDYDAILKTRRLGYDGKGQYRITQAADINQIPDNLFEQDLILEKRIKFKREVSVIVARNGLGEMKTWPLCENKHKEGILTTTIVPAKASELDEVTTDYAKQLAIALNYVGVLVIEFFQTDEAVFVNEMAPRVHNSGHWSIEGADTSQFENHLRAGLNLPLGSTKMQGMAAMLNWIGAFPDNILSINEEKLYWHVYGKEPRPGRKIGHSTLLAATPQELHDKIVGLVKKLGVQL